MNAQYNQKVIVLIPFVIRKRSLVFCAWRGWRQQLGEEQIAALLQESLSGAQRTGVIETKDLERVVVDTTVQEKAIAHP